MKDLQDLVRFTLSGRIGKIETLNSLDGDESSLIFKLYKALAEDKVRTDEEARTYIYGDSTVNPKYDMLKKRFRERLYNTFLFIEPRVKGKDTYFQNVYYSYKTLITARYILGVSPSDEGLRLLEKVFKRALEYELFDVIVQSAQLIRHQYMQKGDINGFRYYSEKLNEAHLAFMADTRAEELYAEVIIFFTRSPGFKPEYIELAEANLKEVRKIQANHDSVNLNYYAYSLELLILQLKGNYQEALLLNYSYENYFLSKKLFYSPVKHAKILTLRVYCCLHVGQFEEGQVCAEKVLGMYNSGTENWFTHQEVHFLIALNAGNMDLVCKVYLDVINHTRFPIIREFKQEIWKLYGGYLWFMLKFKEEETLRRDTFPDMERFSLGKFMNEMPLAFSKDKTGYNVALLILQVLILVERNDLVSIISRTEALKSYIYKNLKKEEARRSFWFIKMLMLLERHNFDPVILRTKAEKYLSGIKSETVGYEATPMRMEIIPYEEIWEIIIQMLERQQKAEKGNRGRIPGVV